MRVREPKNVRPYCQNQSLLFPPNLLDFIQHDDLCMVVDDVVNTLDLSCLYRKTSYEGNMSYHPKMMLKVLFYSYASGIFSSRRIDKALGENIALIYLAAWQRPDFRTVNNFRRNNLSELEDLFVQIVRLCQQLKMVTLGHISIDGSKFKANAADRQSYDRIRIEKEMKRLLEKAAEKDREEDALYGSDKSGDELPKDIRDRNRRIERLKELRQQLDQEDKKKLNEKLEGLEGVDAYIPDDIYQGRSRGHKDTPFDKDKFIYDESADVFTCPAGKTLSFWQSKQDKCADYRVYRCRDCKTCPHFGECTKSKRGRTIWRMVGEERIKEMRAKLDTDEGKAIYAKRKHIVEPVFGHIKAVIGFTGFHLRGLRKVNGEFMLVAIAHNLKKISKWGYKKGIGLTPMAESA